MHLSDVISSYIIETGCDFLVKVHKYVNCRAYSGPNTPSLIRDNICGHVSYPSTTLGAIWHLPGNLDCLRLFHTALDIKLWFPNIVEFHPLSVPAHDWVFL